MVRGPCILDKAIMVGIAVDVDPLQGGEDIRPDLLEEVAVKYDALMGLPDASRLWKAKDG